MISQMEQVPKQATPERMVSFNGSVQRDSILSMPMAAPTMLPVVPALQSVSIPHMTAFVMVRVFSFDNLRRTPPRSTREQKALPKKSLSVRSAPHTGIWVKYRLHNESKASDRLFPHSPIFRSGSLLIRLHGQRKLKQLFCALHSGKSLYSVPCATPPWLTRYMPFCMSSPRNTRTT